MGYNFTPTLTNEDYAFVSINELYGRERHTGPPATRVWILLEELKALQEKYGHQEPPPLPLDKGLEVLKEIQNRL